MLSYQNYCRGCIFLPVTSQKNGKNSLATPWCSLQSSQCRGYTMIFIDWLVTINCSFLYCVTFRGTHALVFKELNWVPFRSYSDLPRAIWWFLSQFSWNLDCGIIRWLNSSPSSGNTSWYPLGSGVATGICLFETQTPIPIPTLTADVNHQQRANKNPVFCLLSPYLVFRRKKKDVFA